MKRPYLAIVKRHTERGPDAAGATSENLLPRRPRRGQAAAPLAFSGPINCTAEKRAASRSASREGRGNRPCEAFGNLPPGKVPNPVGREPGGCVERVGRRRGARPNTNA